MPLIVAPDDGFDSLIGIDFADTYHANMGHSEWDGIEQPKKEAALRQATQYIIGRRVLPQYLNPVHARVQAATAEAALRAAAGALYSDINSMEIVASESVGPISTTYRAPRNGGRMTFPVIDDLLLRLTDSAVNIKLVRA